MTTPIDYSRPVGWWCPVCGAAKSDDVRIWDPTTTPRVGMDGETVHRWIPVYLPMPEGQRPPAANEVEEAEIATSTKGAWTTWYGIGSKGRMVYRAECSWNYTLDTEHIERVTGATE